MKKVVEKIGGIVLSGALVLNTLGSVPQLKVHATPSETSVSAMGVSDAVGEFLNVNALNVKNGDGNYDLSKQDTIEALYSEKTSISSKENETAINKIPKVYFGGNEYYIVNAENDEATLVAYKPYLNGIFQSSSVDQPSRETYKDSKVYNYLTKTGTEDADKVYDESKKNLYQDFFAGKRELEWNLVEDSTIYARIPNSNITNNSDMITSQSAEKVLEAAKLKNQKFYLMGGKYKGGRVAGDAAQNDVSKKSCEPYAYAGSYENRETGYAVHCGLFGTGKYPWLRSA